MGVSNVKPRFGGRTIRPLPLSARLPSSAALLIVSVAYYGTAILSLRVALVLHQVTPFWPPTGIALVGLLVFGRRVWPGIALAAFLVNAPISASLGAAAAISVGNTLGPLAAALALHRLGFRTELDRFRDALALVVVALLAMILSATGGTLTLLLSGAIGPEAFLPTWSVWWTGDAMGILIVVPFLLSLPLVRNRLWGSWPARLESLSLFLALFGVGSWVFRAHLGLEYLMFPFLAWAAWRFGKAGAAPAALLISGMAAWSVLHGTGPFGDQGLPGRMISLQVFNACTAFASLLGAALVAERKRNIGDRDRAQEELAHQASHDPLTGLANRVLFIEQLRQALARAARHGSSVAVLFLDLDRFKVINDSLGHEAGDRVLVCMAERLRSALRPGDVGSRFGGDEFVVLCEDVAGDQEAVGIADRLSRIIAQPVEVDSAELVVTTSIGIALSRESNDRPEALIRDADAAVYRAKERGRARYEFFDHDMRVRAVRRLSTENQLRRAMARGDLSVYYQPLVRVPDGGVEAVEALVRWNHPQEGLVGPAEFIPVAEETGLIAPLGEWVLGEACRQLARWRTADASHPELKVTVNVSAGQLARKDFEDAVADVLSETGVPPSSLSLEITESLLMEASPFTQGILRRLRGLGLGLTIDDFGTGYSSLTYLKRFHVDALKVDRSFVDGLGRDEGDSAIVAAVVSLAHALRLSVVAEGVETLDQLRQLKLLGCDLAQGYHFAPALPPEGVEELLTRQLDASRAG
jgi:diguanylate cyclase (GGDEF)-like protein